MKEADWEERVNLNITHTIDFWCIWRSCLRQARWAHRVDVSSLRHPWICSPLFSKYAFARFFQLSVELSSAYLGIYSVNLYRIVQMDSTVEDLINSITYIYIFCITSVNQECAWWDAVPNFVSRNPPLHARLSSKHVVKHWPILSSYCFRCNFPLLWNTSNLISRILIFHTFPTLVNKIRLTRFFLIRLK